MRQDQINFYTHIYSSWVEKYLIAFKTQQNKYITLNAIDKIKDKQRFCCSQGDVVKNDSKPLPNYRRYICA